MMFDMRLKKEREIPMPSVVGQLDGYSQTLIIDSSVFKHILQYRQITAKAKEAGGQLFGNINDSGIHVRKATGPYLGDRRRRSSYRSNQIAAQCAINRMSKKGYWYLGEWHTHAEDHPTASSMDRKAMNGILNKSDLNTNELLLFIVGRDPGVKGLAIWSSQNKEFLRWKLSFLME